MRLEALLRRFFPRPPQGMLHVSYGQIRLTPKRLINLRLLAWERKKGKTRLRALPVKLVLEATNVCNLNCPACFTGVGENGRLRSAMSLDLYRKVMNELGDTLCEMEFYNWGEPLLSKSIYTMIAEASARGIATTVSTNFSIPFDAEKAEQLVRSGLTNLAVSIDGARQESYEKYRVGGDLKLVLDNCRLVAEARRRLGSKTPKMIWSYHVFAHNVDDIPLAREIAKEIGFDMVPVSKGLTIGEEWQPDGPYKFLPPRYQPVRCDFLWFYAVIHNEGGVAPCCGTFYREDDMGHLSVGAEELGARTFREIWNSPNFVGARELFGDRATGPNGGDNICATCPQTLVWRESRRHVAQGKDIASYVPPFSPNDGHNYFFNRRPKTRNTRLPVRPERKSSKERKTPLEIAE